MINTDLLAVIESLEDGVNVSYEALDDPDRGYTYATRYSRVTMTHAIECLKLIIEQNQKEND
tara:strand:- start:1251 stop:1436 length:186 start_codon:yes stop_codon:yes gene_type:complete